MTMTLPWMPVIISAGAPTLKRPVGAPIFEQLVADWTAAGRAVPGRNDPEWSRLAGQSPWPDR
ncbi:hypothetical protein [Streptomyces triculaminicus]|uniref:hypothetical protein n=1 Tax=Streptomyces triculaminicus TaxID=2816232 RepID=UPI0037D6CC1B